MESVKREYTECFCQCCYYRVQRHGLNFYHEIASCRHPDNFQYLKYGYNKEQQYYYYYAKSCPLFKNED